MSIGTSLGFAKFEIFAANLLILSPCVTDEVANGAAFQTLSLSK